MKFSQDRDMFSKVDDGTIPYSNCSQSVRNTYSSWFVPISTLLPTTCAKSLTPSLSGDSESLRDRDRFSEILDVTIPYSNSSQSVVRNRRWYHSVLQLLPKY